MIINAYRDRPDVVPNTRILRTTLGLLGTRISDPRSAERTWEVQGFYTPLENRSLGGVRAKLRDNRGFITFCNQRDFEVLIGEAKPGQPCLWANQDYVAPTDRGWFGFSCDDDDLLDDLFERELLLREQAEGYLLHGNIDIERRVHVDFSHDVEELLVFFSDVDPDTGLFPDPRFETLHRRWIRAERRRVRWEKT